MKKILLFIILISNSLFSQKLNLNNSLGFNYQYNNIKTYTSNITSINSYEYKNITYSNSLNHNLSYSSKVNQNELANKFIINWSKNNYMIFLTNQTNYSLTRNINIENLFGGGFGRRDSIIGIKINYSIGLLYDKIYNQNLEYLRYSVRIKLSQIKPNYNWSTEFYYQPDILNSNNIILYGTSKMNFKMNNYLSFSLVNVYNYYSIAKVKKINTFTLGITYNYIRN